jgi:hypothetical protein
MLFYAVIVGFPPKCPGFGWCNIFLSSENPRFGWVLGLPPTKRPTPILLVRSCGFSSGLSRFGGGVIFFWDWETRSEKGCINVTVYHTTLVLTHFCWENVLYRLLWLTCWMVTRYCGFLGEHGISVRNLHVGWCNILCSGCRWYRIRLIFERDKNDCHLKLSFLVCFSSHKSHVYEWQQPFWWLYVLSDVSWWLTKVFVVTINRSPNQYRIPTLVGSKFLDRFKFHLATVSYFRQCMRASMFHHVNNVFSALCPFC